MSQSGLVVTDVAQYVTFDAFATCAFEGSEYGVVDYCSKYNNSVAYLTLPGATNGTLATLDK